MKVFSFHLLETRHNKLVGERGCTQRWPGFPITLAPTWRRGTTSSIAGLANNFRECRSPCVEKSQRCVAPTRLASESYVMHPTKSVRRRARSFRRCEGCHEKVQVACMIAKDHCDMGTQHRRGGLIGPQYVSATYPSTLIILISLSRTPTDFSERAINVGYSM